MSKTELLTVRVSAEDAERYRARAAAEGVTLSDLARRGWEGRVDPPAEAQAPEDWRSALAVVERHIERTTGAVPGLRRRALLELSTLRTTVGSM